MLTHSPTTQHPKPHLADSRPAVPRSTASSSRLRLGMDYSHPELALLTVAGDVDGFTTPQLAEFMWPRLSSTLTVLVLDCSEVSFLGVDALDLLTRAHSYAAHRGITLCLIGDSPPVERALAAGGLASTLPCFTSVDSVRATL